MPKFRVGKAIVAFEQPLVSRPGERPQYVWHATHIEKFEPYEDTTQLVVELWMDQWDTTPTNNEIMATTWENYPEDPLIPLDEPLFTVTTADTRDVVRKAFADFQNLDWVVTVDIAANVKVWKSSHHPVHDFDGGQQTITFTPVPSKIDEIERWLAAMNDQTRVVAGRVKAVMRFHQRMKTKYLRKSPPSTKKEGAENG